MRAHVDLDGPLAPFRLMEAINAHLRPEPIAIVGCQIVADNWHTLTAAFRAARWSDLPWGG